MSAALQTNKAAEVPHMVDTKATPAIVLDKVNKWYGTMHVLRDVSLTIANKERVVVCGPSGSGKSTLIRCINRLETHQEGHIIVDGTELTDDTRALDTIRREVGMVFQSFNLFPHLTILENCTLAPIWVRKMPKAEAAEDGFLQAPAVKPAPGEVCCLTQPWTSGLNWTLLPTRCSGCGRKLCRPLMPKTTGEMASGIRGSLMLAICGLPLTES